MNLLDAAGNHREAVAVGKEGLKEVPNLALALALAQRLEAAGNTEEAVWAITGVADSLELSTGNWELVCEAAQFLAAHKRAAEAIDLYKRLFATDLIPAAVKGPWIKEARATALKVGDTSTAAEWNAEMAQSAEKALIKDP
jgi:hypothetical protein